MVVQLNFDGACAKLGNLELISCGVVGRVNGALVPELYAEVFAGYGTNNMAEWEGLKTCLELISTYLISNEMPSSIHIVGDSKLIVNQFNGKFACRQPHLKEYYVVCKSMYAALDPAVQKLIKVSWVKRDFNTEADLAAEKAMKNYFKNLK